MAKIKLVLLSIVFAAMLPFGALAGSYIQLGGAKKASSVQKLYKEKKKTKVNLQLGKLRTDDAKLPTGKLTLPARMRLRAKQALQRQNAISRAKRKKANASSNPNESEIQPPNYEVGEGNAPSYDAGAGTQSNSDLGAIEQPNPNPDGSGTIMPAVTIE